MVTSGTVAEGEPNDIFTGVDMLGAPMEGGQVAVTGSVGGPCDEDHYAFIVPAGASASVYMYGPGLDPSFQFARNLDETEYHLIVNAFATASPIPYELAVDIQPTTP